MKAKIITILSFCLLLLVSGCDDKPSSSNKSSEEATSTHVTSAPTSTDVSSSEPFEESSDEPVSDEESSEESSSLSSSEQSTINEELEFMSNSSRYGNTNGNTMNRSLAVYDWERKVHYYANRGSIYAYNPVTATSTELLADMVNVTYLTLYENYIYFIGGTENYLYTYNLLSMTTDLVLERYVSYASRQTDYLYLKTTIEGYGDDFYFVIYDLTNMAMIKSTGLLDNVNHVWNKVIYTDNEPFKIKLAAYNLSGRTTLANFTDGGFKALNYVHLLSEDYFDESDRLFFVSLQTQEGPHYYFYEKKTDTLTFICKGGAHSVNNDDKYLYLVIDRDIVVYNYVTKSYERTFTLGMSVRNLNVINHYFYYQSGDNNDLYMYHPEMTVPLCLTK
ncbi:MAG: hypothetical protein BWX74_00471 [Tenericutes bacterium ADurb.Bin087]|nr:MAG: hypothetical protein BWX74_00471 [Tenericutes bacterium ADurb.Bin087]